MRVLVTGAAGFIGAAAANAIERAGHEVRRLDGYIAQAHGPSRASTGRPGEGVVRADVRDLDALAPLLAGVDVVCHQAAMVGAGLTAADLPLFASHNDLGTATLLAAMAAASVGRLVLASSMVVYGDGRYVCARHGHQPGGSRSLAALGSGQFEVACPRCGKAMGWDQVDEGAALVPRSGYAASKVAQEHFVAAWTRQTASSAVALRYHNVYGPNMPADTPYSGVAAIFRSALEHRVAPRVFEDGQQMRDFVHVDDVAAMNRLAVEVVTAMPGDTFSSYNVCSGRPISIADVARLVSRGVGGERIDPVVSGEFRAGDVRHIVASPDKAQRELGFRAEVSPEQGLARFATDPLRQ